jgi:hypothetical protein
MKTSGWFALAIVVAAVSVVACSAPAPQEVIVSGETPFAGGTQGSGGSAATGATGASGGTSTGAGATTDLPCDVATYLASKCTSCHGDPPLPSALAGLVTLADLKATSKEDPTKNEAQLSVARMQNAAMPMPPGALPSAADVAILQNWINAGYPTGSCGDVGVPMSKPAVSVFKDAPPFPARPPVAEVISTTEVPQHVDYEKKDCMTRGCHAGGDGPRLNFGGTLYDGAGMPVAGAEVLLVDADGKMFSAYTASNGTFYSRQQRTDAGVPIAPVAPSHVGVRNAAHTVDMLTALAASGGACNSCHCVAGDGGASTCTVAPIHLP